MFLCAAIVLFISGCVTKRTVTEDGVVVAEGYYMKGLSRSSPNSY